MDSTVEALLNDGGCRLGLNRDVNEVAAIVLASPIPEPLQGSPAGKL